MEDGEQRTQSSHNSFSLSVGQVEVLKSVASCLSRCFCLPCLCCLGVELSLTPFVSITSFNDQCFGGPTCRRPGAGHCSPWASLDYPQKERQLRPRERAINLHKLQPATLPRLSLDERIMHCLLNGPQTDSREDEVIACFPINDKVFLEVLFFRQHYDPWSNNWHCRLAEFLTFLGERNLVLMLQFLFG